LRHLEVVSAPLQDSPTRLSSTHGKVCELGSFGDDLNYIH